MKVTFAGTRGSVPIANRGSVKYGGNTTCLRIESDCLPQRHWLFVDAGTGIVPLGHQAVESNVDAATILFTHYHHDHTQGLLLCPVLFNKRIRLNCYGPIEAGIGPAKMLEEMMRPPFFPLSYTEVASHISGKGLEHPCSKVLVCHPTGGFKLMSVHEFEAFENGDNQVPFGTARYPLIDCLVVRMYWTNHPERTVSYRFEERRTNQVFVFLTDHENQDGIPQRLLQHLRHADLLVMDSQYSRERYDKQTAGFGHGTPDYCVRVAHQVEARWLGLTHHDPLASDASVDHILEEAQRAAIACDYRGQVFACADFQQHDLGKV